VAVSRRFASRACHGVLYGQRPLAMRRPSPTELRCAVYRTRASRMGARPWGSLRSHTLPGTVTELPRRPHGARQPRRLRDAPPRFFDQRQLALNHPIRSGARKRHGPRVASDFVVCGHCGATPHTSTRGGVRYYSCPHAPTGMRPRPRQGPIRSRAGSSRGLDEEPPATPHRYDQDETVGRIAEHPIAVPGDAVVAVAVEVAPHRADRDAISHADGRRHHVDVGRSKRESSAQPAVLRGCSRTRSYIVTSGRFHGSTSSSSSNTESEPDSHEG
jgi:hypothetical protein